MIIVFIAPTISMKYSCFSFLKKEDETIADCEEDMPGRNPATVQVVSTAVRDFIRVVFLSLSLVVIFCRGIWILSFSESIKVEVPKSPESNGKRGSFIIFRLRVITPRVPDSIMISIADVLDFFSLSNRKDIDAISKYGMYSFMIP